MKAAISQIRAQPWIILAGAATMLSLSMGMRQSFGLFQPHIIRDLGITASDFSLAMAVQNVAWGLSQPLVGLFADRFGVRYVTLGGAVLYAAGLITTVSATSAALLVIGAGVCVGVALSCTASSIAMSITSRTVDATARSVAMGSVSAVGSLGLVIASLLGQSLISAQGWHAALLGYLGLVCLMLIAALAAGRVDRMEIPKSEMSHQTFRTVLGTAFGHRGFVVMAIAYFVCGLQLAFLTTHLPNYLSICGMDPLLGATALSLIGFFNVVGSYLFGWLGGRFPRQILLGGLYITRSIAIGLYFSLPATTTSTLLFSAAMGTVWLAVVPLVNGLVSQFFGLRYMTTLVGIAFLSHQAGAFLGAWGGGAILDWIGNYDAAWKIAVVVGLVAGIYQMLTLDRPPSGKRDPAPSPVVA